MPLLNFLRQSVYTLFLLYAASFLVLSLLMTQGSTNLAVPHAFTMYGTLLSMLLAFSFSMTLLICKPATEEGHGVPLTAWITLAACILVSAMIAAALFFL